MVYTITELEDGTFICTDNTNSQAKGVGESPELALEALLNFNTKEQ